MFGGFRRGKLSKWVLKTDIAYIITNAKIQEATILNKLHAQELKDLTELKDVERIGEVEELKSANKRLQETLDSQKKKMKYVENMRISVISKAKGNAQITGELKVNSIILRDHISQFYGLSQGLATRALDHLKDIEKLEEIN